MPKPPAALYKHLNITAARDASGLCLEGLLVPGSSFVASKGEGQAGHQNHLQCYIGASLSPQRGMCPVQVWARPRQKEAGQCHSAYLCI